MAQLLFVTPEPSRFADLSAGIASLKVTVNWATSGGRALETLGRHPVDLVVADEDLGDMTGLGLIGRLVALNPMINCAVVSSLSEKAFHEASEGLGILMSLPSRPSRADGQRLMTHLNQVLGFTTSIKR